MSPIDKSKLSREEREAQYKAARERIFGDFQESVTSESASTGENSASLSRSSSSSGKRKARKHKTPKDDSFEARSAFTASYAPMHMQNMPAQYQPQYPEQAYPGSYQGHPGGYGANMNYGTTPTQSYPHFEPSMQYNGAMGYGPSNTTQFNPADTWSSIQSSSPNGYYNYSASPPGYQQNVSPVMPQMNNQFMQQPRSGMQQPQNWLNNQFQAPYHQPPGPAGSNVNNWSGYQPTVALANATSYAYGQLPAQNYAANPPYNAQQPVPGSYSRSLFNPQTRSFVPNNASSRNGGRNGKRKSIPSSGPYRANTVGKPDLSGVAGFPTPRGFDKGLISSSSPMLKEDSLQQRYGAPAHLPKKPPPSQVLSSYDVENINNAPLSQGPLALSGATNGSVGSPPA